jgi:hypothetical protein
MKKVLSLAVGIALLGLVAPAISQAKEKKEGKSHATAEQKTLRKELMEKYDANKDGKLDKEEKGKISAEDKEKMEKAGMTHKKSEGDKK